MSADNRYPVPCPHEGDKEACERCWASHDDATPYCVSREYIEQRGDPKRIAHYNEWATETNTTCFGGREVHKLIVTRTA